MVCSSDYASGGSLLAGDGEREVGRRGGKRRAPRRTNWLELARAGVPVFADDSGSLMEGKLENR